MKIRLICLLGASLFAFNVSASIDENFEAVDQTEEQFEALDQNDELKLNEENKELLLGPVGATIGGAIGSIGDAISSAFKWTKDKARSAKDLVTGGFSRAAKLAEDMGITGFIKEIPLKVLQAGEEATIQFLLKAAKFGLKAAIEGVALMIPGVGNAVTGALAF